MGEGKSAEFVHNGLSIGGGRKQPVEVVLVDALREESDDFEELAGVRAEPAECRGSEREFYGCSQTLVVIRSKDLCTM